VSISVPCKINKLRKKCVYSYIIFHWFLLFIVIFYTLILLHIVHIKWMAAHIDVMVNWQRRGNHWSSFKIEFPKEIVVILYSHSSRTFNQYMWFHYLFLILRGSVYINKISYPMHFPPIISVTDYFFTLCDLVIVSLL
jgi:hypothetical protein